MTQCTFFRTHAITEGIVNELFQLRKSDLPLFLSFDTTFAEPPQVQNLHCCNIQDLKNMTFFQKSWHQVKRKDISIFKHNPEYSLLHFYHFNKQFDYYWFIEDDVRYINNGDWNKFFHSHDKDTSDLLSYHQRSNKPINKDIQVDADESHYTNMNLFPYVDVKLNSFLQIARYSNKALKCLFNAYYEGASGLNELIVPTVLHAHKMKIGQLNDGYFDKRFYSDLPIRRSWVEEHTKKPIIVHSIKD